jgi:acetyl-CoA carboxylase, biotin carboxylase subunit
LFNKILIANRGEIALRIIRACKEMNINSVAVYSEADKTSPHTKYADEAYYIGESPSSESYLNQNKIISIAKQVGADAVHPGYGFFSENAGFIEAVEDSGITFIGPSSSSVKMMGIKTAARQLMSQYNVPIVPGTTSPIKSVSEGLEAAIKIGFPILLKAAAGGGGKGMKLVTTQNEFASSFESAQREALKFFADDSVYIEKYIENPKHIEVQIFGDKLGNYVHIFERECSIQRRHQKIIEEAPSSFVDNKTRKKITQAAINAAKACGYYNAGTIEFLMDKNSNFYFLEMNTRLQVEHPVTEMITGLDLVKEQINVAAGEKLSFNQGDIKINGHSIEARIYAEDPENNFLPSTGKLLEFLAPSGPGIRIDAGFSRGSLISLYYDPLIAKLAVWGKTRHEALERLKRALSEFQIAGVTTNISLLKAVCNNINFIKGDFDINFMEKEFTDELQSRTSSSDEVENAVVIISSLLKVRSSSSEIKNAITDNNKWTDLQYE